MGYEGNAKGEPLTVFVGISERGDTEAGASLDEAIRAAVHASRARPGTRFVLSHIEVETTDDPNVGAYKVIITPDI